MEKRVFLAILLSFVVLLLFQWYLTPQTPPATATSAGGAPTSTAATASTPSGQAQTPAAAPAGTPAAAAPTTPAAPTTGPAVKSTAPPSSATPVIADTAAHTVTVDTSTVHAEFSTRGAVLTSWQLKKYLRPTTGKPLDLVPEALSSDYVKPFTLKADDPSLTATLTSALYRPSATSLSLGDGTGTLTFEYQDASGLRATKTFVFQPKSEPYLVDVDASVEVGGAARPVGIDWGPALGIGYSEEGSRYATPPAVVQMQAGVLTRPSVKDLEQQPDYSGAFRFAGVGDQYFLSAAMPEGKTLQLAYQPITLPVPGDAKKQRTFIAYSVRAPADGALPYFMGPKNFDLLKSVDPEFVRAIDYGWFGWLVVPLLQALKWINGYIGNFGVSILTLTFLINLVLFPLRHRSMVSMRKMQALQPQIKAIQERYKKLKVTDPDRQKMNTEMMALYKEKGVNPASGCLPMLLTFPLLFAFYRMLTASVELRGAPFFGWIHDLSAHDPLFITPVLMGVTMLWQQKMMPTTADPVQQKMLLLMPIVFTVTFLWLPSGVALYYLASNMMAIGQQAVTYRMIGTPGPAAAVSGTASERRAKRAAEKK